MPLNAATLSTAIQAEIAIALGVTDPSKLQIVADGIANAIVTHITSNAVVTLNNGADSNGDTLIDLTGTIT